MSDLSDLVIKLKYDEIINKNIWVNVNGVWWPTVAIAVDRDCIFTSGHGLSGRMTTAKVSECELRKDFMYRMDDMQLQTESSEAATRQFKDTARNYDIVFLNLIVNAYASGYYMGVRHYEKYGHDHDNRLWWKLLNAVFFSKYGRPTLLWYSQDAAKVYVQEKVGTVQGYERASLLTMTASAFREGFENRMNKDFHEA